MVGRLDKSNVIHFDVVAVHQWLANRSRTTTWTAAVTAMTLDLQHETVLKDDQVSMIIIREKPFILPVYSEQVIS